MRTEIYLENKGISFYFLYKGLAGGIYTGIKGNIESIYTNGIFFIYDEYYLDALNNDTSAILEIFDWLKTDDFNLIEDCFKFTMLLWEDRLLKNYKLPLHNKELFTEEYSFLKRILTNPYVESRDKETLISFLKDPKNTLLKEVKERKIIDGYIYLIESLGYYKIGKTKKLTDRMKNFNTIFPAKITEIHVFKTEDINNAELVLHKNFEHLRHIGEWFNLSQEDVDYICSIKDYDM